MVFKTKLPSEKKTNHQIFIHEGKIELASDYLRDGCGQIENDAIIYEIFRVKVINNIISNDNIYGF